MDLKCCLLDQTLNLGAIIYGPGFHTECSMPQETPQFWENGDSCSHHLGVLIKKCIYYRPSSNS